MPKIILALYLLFLLAAGWRLFGIGWSRAVKIGAGVALACPAPLLFLLPALFYPGRPFADLQRAIGIALLAGGIACLLGGFATAWLRARRA